MKSNTPPELPPTQLDPDGPAIPLLHQHGVLIVREFVEGKALRAIQEEHEIAFSSRLPGVTGVRYRVGIRARALRIMTADIASVLPWTYRFLTDERLQRIGTLYLGPGAAVNAAAYLTMDRPDEERVTELHYDRIHAFKSFLYLTDTDHNSGALEVDPGSHGRSGVLREEHHARGLTIEEIPITIGHDRAKPVAICGDAGTLILLDTDCLHCGGLVRPGRVRRILRGHSHARQ